MNETAEFILDRVENIMVKGENAGHQHFLIFQQCFQQPHFVGCKKSGFGQPNKQNGEIFRKKEKIK